MSRVSTVAATQVQKQLCFVWAKIVTDQRIYGKVPEAVHQ